MINLVAFHVLNLLIQEKTILIKPMLGHLIKNLAIESLKKKPKANAPSPTLINNAFSAYISGPKFKWVEKATPPRS